MANPDDIEFATIEGLDNQISVDQMNKYLEYLDDLRESGATNMFGAGAYLIEVFNLNSWESACIVSQWMKTFGERHPHD